EKDQSTALGVLLDGGGRLLALARAVRYDDFIFCSPGATPWGGTSPTNSDLTTITAAGVFLFDGPRMQFQPADTLKSRTYIGLILAQFLAAFNDQAIHASSMFFAINQRYMTEATAISLMPILFYTPWAVFCTLAGYLADRFSKRQSLVFWKM